ncbi:aa3-type cytochrome c oxidase subunit IV [Methylobacterium sp. NEAU 140]|uniref:aa3-type cytochrome c oxidase subunit IV n=1 Tax=Methylobacterium sp. NEAU 140 TaxID=3064945 RepID=UPI0027340C8E|nr:aa3-type cytochrome c oxidase subunit IV [Methylobacterium sp. NEAU 140]MDP4021281.1 aa3-type cytochrome c oxidase subunit IV [Methylobacterium sp. NEAU 140]
MAHSESVSGHSYSPAMDAKTHEQTYRGFVRFVEIATGVVICWVLALAVGGLREAWLLAIFGVVVSGAAGTLGALAPAIGWRAPFVVAVLLALYLAFG